MHRSGAIKEANISPPKAMQLPRVCEFGEHRLSSGCKSSCNYYQIQRVRPTLLTQLDPAAMKLYGAVLALCVTHPLGTRI